jgi:dihydroorotase
MRYLIKNATLFTSGKLLKRQDLLIQDGVLESLGSNLEDASANEIKGENIWVFPGFCDIGAQVNDPGYEHREDIESLQRTGTSGGYTQLAVFPNTQPAIHGKAEVSYIYNAQDKQSPCAISPIGAITKACEGTDIAEMMEMNHAGAIAFSDGRKSLQIGGVMMRALLYVKSFDGLVINRPEDASLFHEPQMHEGITSTSLGMRGQATIAEELMLERDLSLLAYTESRLLVYGVSSAASVEKIRAAKAAGLKVSAAVCIWNLIFTDKDLLGFDPNFKLKPMLRSDSDRKALIEGLKDGTIEHIISNHDAFDAEDKKLEFPYARFGAIALQTMFSAYETYLAEELDLELFINAIGPNNRALLNLDSTKVEIGEKVNLCVFDRGEKWFFDEKTNRSKCDNSPLILKELKAKHILTIN